MTLPEFDMQQSHAARKGGKPFEHLLRFAVAVQLAITTAAIVVFGTLIARMLGGRARGGVTLPETLGICGRNSVCRTQPWYFPGANEPALGKWATGLRLNGLRGRALESAEQCCGARRLSVSFLLLGVGFLSPALTVLDVVALLLPIP
jgi:hypothetical protein